MTDASSNISVQHMSSDLTAKRRSLRVTGKMVLYSLATSVVLFLVATPFGHEHHGFTMVFGNTVWVLFLISVPVLIILAIVAAVQAVVVRLRHR